MDSTNFKRYLILPMLITVGAGLFLLFDQETTISSSSFLKMNDVGKVVDVRNDVRLKNRTTLAWKLVQPGTAISEGDSLFSGEDSSANVELTGKGNVTINPWSLIILNNISQDQAPTIKINYGDISVKPNIEKTWIVEAKGEKIQFASKNEKSVLHLNANQKLTAVSENGDFEVESNGQKNVLKTSSNQVFSSKKTTSAEPAELPPPEIEAQNTQVELQKPAEVKVVEEAKKDTTPPPSKPVPVPASLPAPPHKVEVKPVQENIPVQPKPAKIAEAKAEVEELPLPLPTKKITLKTPQLYSPPDGITAYFPNSSTGSLKFSWAQIPKAVQYVIETSFSNSFEKILWSSKVDTNQTQHVFNVSQKIYWRIKALGLDNNESEWSKPSTVSIGASNGK
ncbi:MAG: hypothetical protein ACXVCY_10735 [Pseudobdellovibrionaceae bacterium]